MKKYASRAGQQCFADTQQNTVSPAMPNGTVNRNVSFDNEKTTLSESDVRDDNRDHYTPSKFGIKLCQMWIDALKTDDEQWYLDGYDLYIDRVIFNPNI